MATNPNNQKKSGGGNSYPSNELLTVPDVSKLLRVSPSTVYTWAESGYLPSMSYGQGRRKCVRFRAKAIDNWLKNRERESRKVYVDGASESVVAEPYDAASTERR